MRSSSGAHYITLDHLRALAALMVFLWHFLHFVSGTPVPFAQAPAIFPLALLDEGHVGVALFMTLSGYLFAKLLDGKRIIYSHFLWNRALRLLPLLLLVITIRFAITITEDGIEAGKYFLYTLPSGIILPTLPNGGWSITAEFHFYLILPLLLALSKKSLWNGVWLIAAALCARLFIYLEQNSVQNAAYFTIIGRIDQFTLGILAHQISLRKNLLDNIIPIAALGFTGFYWFFDHSGGFMRSPGYPSSSPIWIVMSTIEGLFFALLIRWYDTRKITPNGIISKFIGRIGEYSYSIYLLHMFLVFEAAQYIHQHIMNISNFYVGTAWGIVCFLLMLPLAKASYHLVEKPFMRWRKAYIISLEKPTNSVHTS